MTGLMQQNHGYLEGVGRIRLHYRTWEVPEPRAGILVVHGLFEHGGRYYLADYKSNWLGASVEAYGQPVLAAAMGREAYYLQYLIYCVALHRYLKIRMPDYRYASHFGGVRYLFVRGMSARSGYEYGVYADRPSEALIESLDQYLRAGTAQT